MNAESRPSVLIIAPKRSGTNFTHDILGPNFTSAVNEPLGLHNDGAQSAKNPLNPWNFSSSEHVSKEHGHSLLKDDPYGAMLTKSFLGWLEEGGKLIKETDFLYLGWLLASVPLQTIAIERDPRESIASFKKHQLYSRWGFDQKMDQFITTLRETSVLDTLYGGQAQGFAQKPAHQKLALYYSVALLEIARNTKGERTLAVTYRDLTKNAAPTFAEILSFLGSEWNESIAHSIQEHTTTTRDPGVHGTYRAEEDLTPFEEVLSFDEERDVRAICADFGIILPKSKKVFVAKKIESASSVEIPVVAIGQPDRARLIARAWENTAFFGSEKPLSVSKTLTTNFEYATFLQFLENFGIPLSVSGRPLFYNDRADGRIRRNGQNILVEHQYANYPANFVNWLGAFSYASFIGGRLPTRQEWEEVICPDEIKAFQASGNIQSGNVNQEYAGLTPVTLFEPNDSGIYDAMGNASIWLDHQNNPFEKMKAGLEWNHAKERGVFPNPRPWWLGTSGLSFRVVFDSFDSVLPDELFAKRIKEVVDFLTQNHQVDIENTSQVIASMLRNMQDSLKKAA